MKTGDQIHYWTLLEDKGVHKNARRWLAVCKCGTTKTVAQQTLKNGNSHSCGCYRDTKAKITSKTHGDTINGIISPEYSVWSQMIKRCYNSNSSNYHNYGGRGIKVCDRWLKSFENFLSDIGRKPSADYSIDRINNNGDYTPYNTRWATIKEQNRNTRKNRLISFRGETKCLIEWEEITGIKECTIRSRLNSNWTVAEALTVPKGQHRRKLKNVQLKLIFQSKKSEVSIGDVFTQLTVINESPNIGTFKAWTCRCSCGNIKIVRQSSLVSNHTKSCGCRHNSRLKLKSSHIKEEINVIS